MKNYLITMDNGKRIIKEIFDNTVYTENCFLTINNDLDVSISVSFAFVKENKNIAVAYEELKQEGKLKL